MQSFCKLILVVLITAKGVCSTFTLHTSDFEAGYDGWMPDHRLNISSELQNSFLHLPVGFGGGNAGSRLITYNQSASWTGNFINRGVKKIKFDFKNDSGEEAHMRVAFSDMFNPMQAGGTWWISKDPIILAPLSGWSTLSFDLEEVKMKTGGVFNGMPGVLTFDETMSNVNVVRILSSRVGGSGIGDQFYGNVYMDNIELLGTVIPEPNMIYFNIMGALIFILVIFRKYVL